MKKISLLIAFFIGGLMFAQESEMSAYQQDALKLVKITGEGAFEGAFKQVTQMLPEDKREDFLKEVKELMQEVYVETSKIQMEHFTHAEIKEILAFYETPIGKKLQEKTPIITEQSLEYSQKMQYKLMPIMQKYME
jgi:hypothetical protein